jgi:hypothetical protein
MPPQIDTSDYETQINPSNRGYIHLRISRHNGKPITCDWDTIQAIKNQALGENATAVEFYPAQSDVVNEANYRHLWIVDLIPPLNL